MGTFTEIANQSLIDLPKNAVCAVQAIDASEEHTRRLAGLGLTAGREVRVVKRGEPTIVQVYGTRIGIAKSLARGVRVVTNGTEG